MGTLELMDNYLNTQFKYRLLIVFFHNIKLMMQRSLTKKRYSNYLVYKNAGNNFKKEVILL